MPRTTPVDEILKQETKLPNSPLRRSSRLSQSATTTDTPGEKEFIKRSIDQEEKKTTMKTRRSSQSSEPNDKQGAAAGNRSPIIARLRTRRASDTSEDIVGTRVLRSSHSAEPTAVGDKYKSRGISSSPLTVSTRIRRGSTSESETPAESTPNSRPSRRVTRRSSQTEEIADADLLTKSRPLRRGRSASFQTDTDEELTYIENNKTTLATPKCNGIPTKSLSPIIDLCENDDTTQKHELSVICEESSPSKKDVSNISIPTNSVNNSPSDIKNKSHVVDKVSSVIQDHETTRDNVECSMSNDEPGAIEEAIDETNDKLIDVSVSSVEKSEKINELPESIQTSTNSNHNHSDSITTNSISVEIDNIAPCISTSFVDKSVNPVQASESITNQIDANDVHTISTSDTSILNELTDKLNDFVDVGIDSESKSFVPDHTGSVIIEQNIILNSEEVVAKANSSTFLHDEIQSTKMSGSRNSPSRTPNMSPSNSVSALMPSYGSDTTVINGLTGTDNICSLNIDDKHKAMQHDSDLNSTAQKHIETKSDKESNTIEVDNQFKQDNKIVVNYEHELLSSHTSKQGSSSSWSTISDSVCSNEKMDISVGTEICIEQHSVNLSEIPNISQENISRNTTDNTCIVLKSRVAKIDDGSSIKSDSSSVDDSRMHSECNTKTNPVSSNAGSVETVVVDESVSENSNAEKIDIISLRISSDDSSHDNDETSNHVISPVKSSKTSLDPTAEIEDNELQRSLQQLVYKMARDVESSEEEDIGKEYFVDLAEECSDENSSVQSNSNDIPIHGEILESTSDDNMSSDDYDFSDSFIDDDDNYIDELLSGEEYDILKHKYPKRKSRIVAPVSSSTDEDNEVVVRRRRSLQPGSSNNLKTGNISNCHTHSGGENLISSKQIDRTTSDKRRSNSAGKNNIYKDQSLHDDTLECSRHLCESSTQSKNDKRTSGDKNRRSLVQTQTFREHSGMDSRSASFTDRHSMSHNNSELALQLEESTIESGNSAVEVCDKNHLESESVYEDNSSTSALVVQKRLSSSSLKKAEKNSSMLTIESTRNSDSSPNLKSRVLNLSIDDKPNRTICKEISKVVDDICMEWRNKGDGVKLSVSFEIDNTSLDQKGHDESSTSNRSKVMNTSHQPVEMSPVSNICKNARSESKTTDKPKLHKTKKSLANFTKNRETTEAILNSPISQLTTNATGQYEPTKGEKKSKKHNKPKHRSLLAMNSQDDVASDKQKQPTSDKSKISNLEKVQSEKKKSKKKRAMQDSDLSDVPHMKKRNSDTNLTSTTISSSGSSVEDKCKTDMNNKNDESASAGTVTELKRKMLYELYDPRTKSNLKKNKKQSIRPTSQNLVYDDWDIVDISNAACKENVFCSSDVSCIKLQKSIAPSTNSLSSDIDNELPLSMVFKVIPLKSKIKPKKKLALHN